MTGRVSRHLPSCLVSLSSVFAYCPFRGTLHPSNGCSPPGTGYMMRRRLKISSYALIFSVRISSMPHVSSWRRLVSSNLHFQ